MRQTMTTGVAVETRVENDAVAPDRRATTAPVRTRPFFSSIAYNLQ